MVLCAYDSSKMDILVAMNKDIYFIYKHTAYSTASSQDLAKAINLKIVTYPETVAHANPVTWSYCKKSAYLQCLHPLQNFLDLK